MAKTYAAVRNVVYCFENKMEVPQRSCGVSFILLKHPHPAIPRRCWKLEEYGKKTRNVAGNDHVIP